MTNLTVDELSILLVEPSSTQRKIIVQHLKQAGIHSIEGVGSGDAAFTYMKKFIPDLVISAYYLPDYTGTEFVERMRRNAEYENIPFMLISSETRYQRIEPIRQAGVIAILPKPFLHDDLKRALISTIDFIDAEDVDLLNYDPEELRVLVVDDSPMALKHICRVLNNMGVKQITQAANGTQAVEILADNQFDLVVTDYHMPEMDGEELLSHIRSNALMSSVPVMMVTSCDDQARLSSIEQSGVSAICDKPFETNDIKQTLQVILNH